MTSVIIGHDLACIRETVGLPAIYKMWNQHNISFLSGCLMPEWISSFMWGSKWTGGYPYRYKGFPFFMNLLSVEEQVDHAGKSIMGCLIMMVHLC